MKTVRIWMFLLAGTMILGAAGPLEGQLQKAKVRGESKMRVKSAVKPSKARSVVPRRVEAASKKPILKNQRVPSRPKRVISRSTRSTPLSSRFSPGSSSHCNDRVRIVRCLRNNHVHEIHPGFRYFKRLGRCFRRLPCGGLEVFVPGHFQNVSREIAEPGRYEYLNSRVRMPFFGGFGGFCPTVRRKVWVPGCTRIITERVWIPGTWVHTTSTHIS